MVRLVLIKIYKKLIGQLQIFPGIRDNFKGNFIKVNTNIVLWLFKWSPLKSKLNMPKEECSHTLTSRVSFHRGWNRKWMIKSVIFFSPVFEPTSATVMGIYFWILITVPLFIKGTFSFKDKCYLIHFFEFRKQNLYIETQKKRRIIFTRFSG